MFFHFCFDILKNKSLKFNIYSGFVINLNIKLWSARQKRKIKFCGFWRAVINL